jgi:glycosyltransferase involved in cell wall biosynthesis
MKIVQILPELNEGGVERGTMELNREFVALGHESIVISCGGKLVSTIEADGGKHISLDVCSKNPFTALVRIYKLRNVLRKLKPDIVHARSRVPAWLTYFANKSLKIPFVTTVHGLNSINPYSRIMTKGDRVICVGEAVQEYIINGYNLDNNDNRITTIQRGVDLSRFNTKNLDTEFIGSFKKKYKLADKYIVTSVGRITKFKDYETFIEAIAIAKLEIPNIIGLIVGGARSDKQEYLESLQRLSTELGVENNIKFVGSQSKIIEIYSISNILISTTISKKMGNISRAIIEALALDVPVICTTSDNLIDIVIDGINGAIIESKNISQLATKIIEVRNHNYQNVSKTIPEEYTLDMMTKSTLDVYRNILLERGILNANKI